MLLDPKKTQAFVQGTWDRDILPTLTEYVKIPAKSPLFDADWQAHGHIDRAVALIERRQHRIIGGEDERKQHRQRSRSATSALPLRPLR